jgi:hypothetical protein
METEITDEQVQSQIPQETGEIHRGAILELDIVNQRNRSARQEMEDYNKMREIVCVTPADYEFVNTLFKKIAAEYKTQAESARVYLFDWDGFPENGGGNLIEFLIQKFKANWVKSANLEKSADGKKIIISAEEKRISLELRDKDIVNLKQHGDVIYKLTAKRENGKLNVYAGVKNAIAKRGYGPKMRHVMTFLREHAVYDNRDIQEFAGRFVGTELR